MERCPCCNARLTDSIKCPRCQADLSAVVNAEQAAKLCLANAVNFWIENKTEQSLDALEQSIILNKTALAINLRDFFIDQQCRVILQLLAEKQIIPAKTQLYRTRTLFPYNAVLRQLNNFADYLLLTNVNISD